MTYGTGILRRKIEGHDFRIDGRNATILAEIPEEIEHESSYYDSDDLIYVNPSDLMKAEEVLPSFSMIRFAKVKNFIDGVYAAVEERISENGHGASRPDFLNKLAKITDGYSSDYIYRSLNYRTGNDPAISKPQGFYHWSPNLTGAYKRIKILGTEPRDILGETGGLTDKEIIEDLHQKIDSVPELKKTYNKILGIYSRMTGEHKDCDCLFPPAKLPDQEFFMNLSERTKSDIEEGLGKALVEGIKNGEVDYTPDENSGLYVRQMHEIVPLIKRDTEEFEKYQINKKYAEILENEFVSQWAGTRHTHVGHTDFKMALIGCSMTDSVPKIVVRPELKVEPLSTSYSRMGENVKFMEETVKNQIPEVLDDNRLIKSQKRSKSTIGEDFGEMKSLLNGLSMVSNDSIHIKYKDRNAKNDMKTVTDWIENGHKDPDMDRNVMIFVPIIRTTDGTKQIGYINAGFKLMEMEVSYDKKPEIKTETPLFHEFGSNEYELPVLVHREVRIPYEDLINDKDLRVMLGSEFVEDNVFRESELDEFVKRLEKGYTKENTKRKKTKNTGKGRRSVADILKDARKDGIL